MKLKVVGTLRVPSKAGRCDFLITAKAQLFSPDTRLYLTAGRRNSKIRIWDFFNTGDELLSLPFGHTATIKTLAFSHDGKILASGSQDGTVLLWDWGEVIKDIMLENKWQETQN